MKTPSCYIAGQNSRGSILLVVLLVLAVSALVSAYLLSKTGHKYFDIVQAESWQESMHAAEAGIDVALLELRSQVSSSATPWTGWGVAANGSRVKPIPLQTVGTGKNGLDAYVVVDAPGALYDGKNQWFRIRSYGTATIPGPARASDDSASTRLRKFSLKKDRLSGAALSRPQVTRVVEAIARPEASHNVGLLGVNFINLNGNNVVVDSFDSTDETKSTNGQYVEAKRQENGDVATNGQTFNGGNATIYGDALTNGGSVSGNPTITGQIRNDFYQHIENVLAPTGVFVNRGALTTVSIIASVAGVTTRIQYSSINLSGQEALTIVAPVGGGIGKVELYITGDFSTSGQSKIVIPPNVEVIIHVAGNMDVSGNGFVNDTKMAKNLQIYGITPTNPSTQLEFKVSGNGQFYGTVRAPSHDLKLAGGGNSGTFVGAFVGKSVTMNGNANFHYDESLYKDGLVSDYSIVSWVEDWSPKVGENLPAPPLAVVP